MTHAVYPSLAGKTVVITGGGSGIGEVMVEGFVRQKSKVFFLDVAENESNALVTRLADGVKFVKCDVTSVPALRAALADIEAKAGPVSKRRPSARFHRPHAVRGQPWRILGVAP